MLNDQKRKFSKGGKTDDYIKMPRSSVTGNKQIVNLTCGVSQLGWNPGSAI
jgi:hypothetical protein